MSRVTRHVFGSNLSLLLLAFVTLTAYRGPTTLSDPPPTRSAPLLQDTLTATVRYVGEGGIDVISGVQFNLKLTHIAVDTSAIIRKAGQPVGLEALRPGDLVDVQYNETGAGWVAERIEVRPPAQGDEP